MKNILLYWCCDADLVKIPDFVADDVLTYQKKFLTWISKKSNNHGYWTRDCEGGWHYHILVKRL